MFIKCQIKDQNNLPYCRMSVFNWPTETSSIIIFILLCLGIIKHVSGEKHKLATPLGKPQGSKNGGKVVAYTLEIIVNLFENM